MLNSHVNRSPIHAHGSARIVAALSPSPSPSPPRRGPLDVLGTVFDP